jgi:soluble lytic murein transglycosylase-like protein
LLLLFMVICFTPGIASAVSIPDWLVLAIIQVESGGNPYAVFANGKTHQPGSREEALRIIGEAMQGKKNYDVGLMQINRFWIEKYAIPPESLLDPAINRQWGAAILADEIARHGMTWKAVGKYHSQDAERGRRYAWRIFSAVRTNKNMRIAAEVDYADQKKSGDSLYDVGGVQRGEGRSKPGRIISFDVPSDD